MFKCIVYTIVLLAFVKTYDLAIEIQLRKGLKTKHA